MRARGELSRRQLLAMGFRGAGGIALAAGLAACAVTPVPGTGKEEKAVTETVVSEEEVGGPVVPKGTLKVSVCPTSAPILPFYQEAYKRFREAYPDIELTVDDSGVGGSTDDYKMKKLAEMAAGTFYDSMHLQAGTFASEFISKGIMLAIDPYIESDAEFDFEDIIEPARELPQYEGKTYGLVKEYTAWLIFYNKAIFEKYGVKDPKDYLAEDRWTWNDGFLEAALNTTKGEGDEKTWGLRLSTGGGYWGHDAMVNVLWSNDADFWKPDPWRCTLDEPEAVDSLKFIADLYLKHKVCPLPGAELPQGYELSYCAMSRGASWFLSMEGMRTAAEELGTLDIIRNPYGAETGYSRNQTGAHVYGIPHGAEHPDLGWIWLKWWNTEGVKLGLEYYHKTLPVRESLMDYGPYLESLADWEDPDEYEYAVKTTRILAGPPNASEAVNYLMSQWDRVLLSEISVDEFVATVVPEVNELIQAEA